MVFTDPFFPSAFLTLALAHFVALLSPGQDFFLIVAHSVRNGLKGSRYICLGIASGNAFYIVVVLLCWQAINNHPELLNIIAGIGALYLIWLGWQLMKSCNRERDSVTDNTTSIFSAGRQFVIGFGSALLNPKNALFYMSLMAVILGDDVSLQQQIFAGVWMSLVVLLWDLLIAFTVGYRGIQILFHRHLVMIERGAGLVLFTIGVSLLLSF
ncbi:LysE family translocator [Vibrio sp.]|nr:LysE family translocator [Vibrio sp.]